MINLKDIDVNTVRNNVEMLEHRITQDLFTIATTKGKISDNDMKVIKDLLLLVDYQKGIIKTIETAQKDLAANQS